MSIRKYYYDQILNQVEKEDMHIKIINSLGIDKKCIYIDKANVTNITDTEWDALIKTIRSEDVLHVRSLISLGINKESISNKLVLIIENKVDLVVLNIPALDTRKYKKIKIDREIVLNLVLQLVRGLIEEEKSNIKQRQMEGIKTAKKKNVKFGRPKILVNENFNEVYEEWRSKRITAKTAMKLLNLKSNTFYRRVAELEKDKKGEGSNG